VSLKEDIMAVADPIIGRGGTLTDVNEALAGLFGLTIGQGGGDPAGGDVCRYCRRVGKGGHGGLCPEAMT
jgi:hypothetical protein